MSCGAQAKEEETNLTGLLERADRFVSSPGRHVGCGLSQLHCLPHFCSGAQRLHPIEAPQRAFTNAQPSPPSPRRSKQPKSPTHALHGRTRLPFPFVPSPPRSRRSAVPSGAASVPRFFLRFFNVFLLACRSWRCLLCLESVHAVGWKM